MTHSTNKYKFQNSIFLSIFKILVYGIISPSIISFGIYYTFVIGAKESIKEGLKEALIEIFDKSISKNLKEAFLEVMNKSILSQYCQKTKFWD